MKIQRTHLSPFPKEIKWLEKQLAVLQPKSFLEFGGGLTSLSINKVRPDPYVIIEKFEPLLDPIKNEIPNANLINTTWEDIPDYQYDMILIDSSAGYPTTARRARLRRIEALHWCINHNLIGNHMMIHDAFRRSGSNLYAYMANSEDFELVSQIVNRRGFAIFSYKGKEIGLKE